jgi:hypothetical protein
MRIGIIAMGRTGGYNLGLWLSNEFGIPYYHEPINHHQTLIGEHYVVKYLNTEWWELNEKPQFDKTIGLIRENIRESAISYLKAKESGNWREPYIVTDEWIKGNEGELKGAEVWIERANNKLVNINEIELNITYEGIYNRGEDIKRLTDYLDIQSPKYLQLLDSSNRLRKVKGRKQKQLI